MIADIKDSVEANGILNDKQSAYDKILNAKVTIQLYEKFVAVQVKQRA